MPIIINLNALFNFKNTLSCTISRECFSFYSAYKLAMIIENNWSVFMKQCLKLELLVEIPDDLEIELVRPIQAAKNIIANPDKKMTMSVDELAEELQISNTTIYTMVRRNEIPHKKVRGRILFHRQTIEKWLGDEKI